MVKNKRKIDKFIIANKSNKIDLDSLSADFKKYTFIDVTNEITQYDDYKKYVQLAIKNSNNIYIISKSTKISKSIFSILSKFMSISDDVYYMLLNRDNYQTLPEYFENGTNIKIIVQKFLGDIEEDVICNICTESQKENNQTRCNKCGERMCYNCIIKIGPYNDNYSLRECPFCKQIIKSEMTIL